MLSFELLKSGKTIDEIAAERGFVRATIEGHLAHFVAWANSTFLHSWNGNRWKKSKRISGNRTRPLPPWPKRILKTVIPTGN